MEAIEENKSLLKTMYADAKALGEKVNRARDVSTFSFSSTECMAIVTKWMVSNQDITSQLVMAYKRL